EPQPAAARQSGERLAARSFQPEWLLDEGVPPRFEDAARRLEMLIGRQQHMDRVELGVEQLLESGKAARDGETRGCRLGAARRAIAHRGELDVTAAGKRPRVRLADEARAEQADFPAPICIQSASLACADRSSR